MVVFRVDAPLYFANAEFLQEALGEVEAALPGKLRALVLDFSSVTDLDSTADRVLHEIADDYRARGVEFYLANVKGIILDVMRRSGLYERLGADHFFVSTYDAVARAEIVIGTPEIDVRRAPMLALRLTDGVERGEEEVVGPQAAVEA